MSFEHFIKKEILKNSYNIDHSQNMDGFMPREKNCFATIHTIGIRRRFQNGLINMQDGLLYGLYHFYERVQIVKNRVDNNIQTE